MLTQVQNSFSRSAQLIQPSFLREILKSANDKDMISFAGGLPEASLFPVQAFKESAIRVLDTKGAMALQYATTEGYYPLRQFISERYKLKQNIDIPPEQILITSGSQQALDLIAKLFLDPGDRIMIERPSYLGAIQCFQQYQAMMIEIDTVKNSLEVEQLRASIIEHRAKFLYSIPNFQNPTGRSLDLKSRVDLAAAVSKTDAYLIEDDPYGDIQYEGRRLPSLYSLLPARTIQLGSFSKIVAPGLRLGWIVASPDIIRKLTLYKQASDLHSSHFDQLLMHDYLMTNSLDEHIKHIVGLYRTRRDAMQLAVEQFIGDKATYESPAGGMFFWLKFQQGIEAMKVLQRCMDRGVIFVPGETFYVNDPERNTARLNFSHASESQINQGIEILGSCLG